MREANHCGADSRQNLFGRFGRRWPRARADAAAGARAPRSSTFSRDAAHAGRCGCISHSRRCQTSIRSHRRCAPTSMSPESLRITRDGYSFEPATHCHCSTEQPMTQADARRMIRRRRHHATDWQPWIPCDGNQCLSVSRLTLNFRACIYASGASSIRHSMH